MQPRRSAAVIAAAAVLSALAAGPAAGHVSVPDEVAAGGIGAFSLTVPNERDDASTVALEVKLPEDHPLALVSVQAKAGWESEVTMRTLDEPVELFGREVTEVVDVVRWTGGTIAPAQYDSFTLRAGPFPEGVEELPLPAIQTYDSGEEVAWIEVAEAGGEEPEHPAPVLRVVAAVAGEEATADEAGHGADEGADEGAEGEDTGSGTAAAADADDDDGSDQLTIVALAVAVAAAGLAAAALVVARRAR